MTSRADFDTQERRSRRTAVLLAVAFYLCAFVLCRMAYGTVLGFVVSSPVLGVYFSWWILHRGGSGLRWFKWLALRKVDGRHHAFQGFPIGVRWADGQCCVRVRDVFQLLGETPAPSLLRRLELRFGEQQFFVDAAGDWWFGERAMLEWLEPRSARLDTQANKFRLWLQREVFPPMHRRSEIG